MEKMPNQEPESRRERHARKRGHGNEFWENIGLDVESMSPKAQVTAGLAVLVPVVLGLGLIFWQIPFLWWLIFMVGWVIFPAFGLLVRGIAGLSEGGSESLPEGAEEKELLGALQRRGELTPAQAAMETSLSVLQADEMLESLAAKGHLDVRVRGGGIFYSLWEHEEGAGERRLEGGQ